MTQEQIRKPTQQEKVDAAQKQAEEDAVRQAQEKPRVDLDYTDELLDEIDSLTEEVEVAVNYRQKGGQ